MAVVARVFRGSQFLMSPAAGVKKARGPPGWVTLKPMPVSKELSRFAGGAPEVARSEALILVWDHIKAHGLQDPVKKTQINCDAKLKSLLGGRDRIGITEIMKPLYSHFLKNKAVHGDGASH